MTMDVDILVSVIDTDTATANQLAGDLQNSLLDDGDAESVSLVRDDPRRQDFGVTLGVILGSSAVTALARGVAKWLARHQEARIKMQRTRPNGDHQELVIEGQPGERAERMITEFFAE